jgi:hypothetical protein
MDAGMAGRADSQEKIRGVLPGAAVMDGTLIQSPTRAAGVPVAFEDLLAMAAEARPGVDKLRITSPAHSGDGRHIGSTGTKQRTLRAARCYAGHKRARRRL